MSVQELKNIRARCIDRNNPEDVVLHEVTFDLRDSGVWQPMITQVMATDPMDAIKYVTNTYKEVA
jgi:hypothetical protein